MQISSETARFILKHQSDDLRTLALQTEKYPHIDMKTAITQIAGKQIAIEKIPTWGNTDDILYPKHLSLEQCSSEVTARYKASLLQGDSLTDLTGGFGVDCSFLASRFNFATYVERQKDLCDIAEHNFRILKLSHISVKNQESVSYLNTMPPVDCIFIDPARRDKEGAKTVAISDCEPDITLLEDLLLDKAKNVMVKLSPMLDLSLAFKELKHVEEAHVVSVNNECKELLLLLGRDTVSDITIHCVNLITKGEQEKQTFVFNRKTEQESECIYTATVGKYLYEPNASLMKAGAFRSVASAFSIKKLHPNSHLYTSDVLIEHFPGRVFLVTDHYSFKKKEIREKLKGIEKANLTIRNFPSSVAELRKRLKLSEGGETYLFATTMNDDRKVLIQCERYKSIQSV